MALIKCEGLSLGYDSKEILCGIDFSVNSGDYLCIIGENGSGKTTLMKTILGLHLPMKGSIEFGDGLTNNEIGYLPQQTELQKDFPASVFEIVLSGCQTRCGLRPFYNRKEKFIAHSAMQKLGICGISDRCYRELSGGQQQRVLLARALAATKKLLLLDEPTAGLDPKVTSEMYAIIKDLNEKEGISVIMISHDIAAATEYASHILHIGESLFFGTCEDYKNSDACKLLVGKVGGQSNG